MTKFIEKMGFITLEQAEFFHVFAAWHVQCHGHSGDTGAARWHCRGWACAHGAGASSHPNHSSLGLVASATAHGSKEAKSAVLILLVEAG